MPRAGRASTVTAQGWPQEGASRELRDLEFGAPATLDGLYSCDVSVFTILGIHGWCPASSCRCTLHRSGFRHPGVSPWRTGEIFVAAIVIALLCCSVPPRLRDPPVLSRAICFLLFRWVQTPWIVLGVLSLLGLRPVERVGLSQRYLARLL